MPILRSAGAVIFRREPRSRTSSLRDRGDKIYYLLLNYAAIGKVEKTYWGFSKGHIEKGEKEIDTIKREIEEETGIRDLKFIKGFKETEKYFFRHKGKTVFKAVYYLLAETKTKEIKISFEHLGYEWLPYEESLEKLTFKNAKKILKKVNDFLSGKSL
jgi:8-oxo-dGTP pyrophosphatase MutT (NUDIX family)